MLKKIALAIFSLFLIVSFLYRATLIRLYQGFQTQRASLQRIKYYQLDDGLFIQDITEKLMLDESIPLELRKPLAEEQRRIVIFKYPSDTEYVAGYLSYIPKATNPVMIFLRGGNGYFGIMRPNNRFSFLNGYNVVGTLYRGNVYGGIDEFGGDDIHDIENLLKYFPQLENFTGIKLSSPYSVIGASRGAMEMFISLSRSEYVKNNISHAISISGNVDLNESMNRRPEMKYLFKTKFKESKATDFESWLQARNPVVNAMDLPKTLKVLLVYGLLDNRVSLEEQQNLKQALEAAHIATNLVIIPDGTHEMNENFGEVENIILDFMKT